MTAERTVLKSATDKLLIEYLPLDMTLEELDEVCSNFGGTVLKKRLWSEAAYLVGLVEFSTKSAMMKVFEEYDGRKVEDWHLRLKCTVWSGGTS